MKKWKRIGDQGWLILPAVLGAVLYAQNAKLSGAPDEWIQYVTHGLVLIGGLLLLHLSLLQRGLEHWQSGWQAVLIATAPGFGALVLSGSPVWALTWIAVTARGVLPALTPILPALFFLRGGDVTVPLACWAAVLIWDGRRWDWLGWAAALGLGVFLSRVGLESPEVTLVQWSPTFLYLALGTYGVAGIFALSGWMRAAPQFTPWRGWVFSALALLAFSQSREWGVITLFLSVQSVAYWQSLAFTRLASALKPRDLTVRMGMFALVVLLNGAETSVTLPWDDSALPRYLAAAGLLVYAERRARA